MNLNILDYGGQKVISGTVGRKSVPKVEAGSTSIKVEIIGPAYHNGQMVMSKEDVIFVDRGEKYALATWVRALEKGSRITVHVLRHEGKLYAVKATNADAFIWTLKDDNNLIKTIIYGPTRLYQTDKYHRYARIVTVINGMPHTVTFWNNPGEPLGERAVKVFSVRSPHCFVVCGQNEPYNNQPYYRGCWFICD